MTGNTWTLAMTLVAMAPLHAGAFQESGEEPVLSRARLVLEAALRERYADVERFDLVLLEPSAARWKKKEVGVDEIVVPEDKLLGKRGSVLVRYREPNGARRESAVWWSIKAFRPVAVARRPIRAHESINESDFIVESHDIAGLVEVVRDIREVGANRRARRFIAAGAPLLKSDLDYAPEVTREQMVTVKVGTKMVLVETVGVAEEEGRTGEIIQIANPVSRMRYPARVTGIGEVSVGVLPK